jgi:hypothetical protein
VEIPASSNGFPWTGEHASRIGQRKTYPPAPVVNAEYTHRTSVPRESRIAWFEPREGLATESLFTPVKGGREKQMTGHRWL